MGQAQNRHAHFRLHIRQRALKHLLSKMENFELELVQMLDKFPSINRKSFLQATRRITKNKWPVVKAKRSRENDEMNPYQKFVKENMPTVVAENPSMTTQERMKYIAMLWDMRMKC